jgi:hypothetical protein
LLLPCAAEEINVSLTIHEALREGVTGIDRIQEPVTVGIPFPKGILSEKNGVPQLALEGVREYQFRTLAKWPDGSMKWVLVDFQTSVKSGGINNNIHVIRGSGNSPGELAEDKGEVISINTGVMSVQIKKKGFNLFDSVIMEGRGIIAKGTSKSIVAIGEEGKEYLALNDSKTKVSIEENGPVRAVIKAKGTHVGNGKRMMDYTVRMHFYKGKSMVRVFYTLRNASKEQFEHAYIRSLDLVTKLSFNGPYQIGIAGHNSVIKEQLSEKDDNVVYYQAVSDFPQEYAGDAFYDKAPIPPDYKREKERGFVQEGYWIKKGERELARGKRKEYPDLAFLDISDKDGKGVTIGIRFAAGWWPKSLRASGAGIIEVGLWPKENKVGYWIRYGSHNTFEVMYEFHDRANDPAASMKKFQYPLVAKASVEWYNRNVKGIYPLYNFVSFAEEQNYIKGKGWDYLVGWRKPKMKVWRYHYWGWGGFLNQHDFARIGLVNFSRETEDIVRAGEYFLGAEARFNYNADWAVYHSDDYDLSATERGKWRLPDPEKNREKAQLAKVVFEWEHPHWYGMPLYYYMTGDERIKEAILDWAEYVKKTHTNITMGSYQRVWGWGMYTLAAMYDFTGDKTFIDIADKNFIWLLENRDDSQHRGSTIFIDWNRGYIAGGPGSGWGKEHGLKPGLMTGYVLFDGLYNYYLYMDESNPLKRRVADVLEGLSEFMYREPYVEGRKGGHWAFWLPYSYNLENKSKSEHQYRLILQAFYVNLADYLFNGGDRWLERIDKTIRMAGWDESGIWDHFGFIDHPGLQSMLYLQLHPRTDILPPEPVKDLSVRVNGGHVILSWTAPADAVRYQIKFSTKKLVESLEFDPDKRIYKYNPAEYANWWAGENILDEINPGTSGTKQQHIIKNLKPGHHYIAIRSWDASNNRSRISNLAEVEIK